MPPFMVNKAAVGHIQEVILEFDPSFGAESVGFGGIIHFPCPVGFRCMLGTGVEV